MILMDFTYTDVNISDKGGLLPSKYLPLCLEQSTTVSVSFGRHLLQITGVKKFFAYLEF